MGCTKKGYISKKKVFKGTPWHEMRSMGIEGQRSSCQSCQADRAGIVLHTAVPPIGVLSGGIVGHLLIHVLQLKAALEF